MSLAARFPMIPFCLVAMMMVALGSRALAEDPKSATAVLGSSATPGLKDKIASRTGVILPPVAPNIRACIAELRMKRLDLPVEVADIEKLKGNFYEGRVGHMHQAVDLLAPRNTPIRAVEDGTIARLFESAAGGLTIYQKDQTGKYVYYYAHLERYDENIHQGDMVKRGQVIGYVGTSGNAPPNTPHLHFAISTIGPQDSVFHGFALDPYEVFKTRGQ